MSVLGLDVGTSTCKGVVLSEDGRILAQNQITYADAVTVRGATAEISANVFEDSAKKVISVLAQATKHDPIAAIAVSSHGETLIPIGRNGRPLCDAILSMDRRSQDCSDHLIERFGQEKIYSITGTMMHPQFPVPKVMWLQQHSELALQTIHYDTANDYIYRMLGCPGRMDYSIASRFGGFDIQKRQWSQELLEAAGVDSVMFSEAVCGGTVIGEMPPSMARSLGLTGQVQLVTGGHDQPCAALAIGGVGDVLPVSAGSYECAILSTTKPLNTNAGFRYGLNSYCHVVPNQYATLAFFVSGMMVNWYLNTFCRAEKETAKEDIYAYMEKDLQASPSGICFTPHIFGAMNPEWSERATAKISGLSANTTKVSLYQAVLEGTCCELDLNIRVLEKLTKPVKKLVMSGGGTHSPYWMQLRADITGKTIDAIQSNAEASCLGAAILAGVGIGLFSSPEDGAKRLQRTVCTYAPQEPVRYQAQKKAYLAMHREGLLD